METLFLVLGWGSPVGTGIFLICLGGMIFLLSKCREEKKEKKD